MFYGQLMMQNYLADPAISFCAIGDAKTDTAPLQVSEFGQGKEIDQLISKMFLEGNGGGNEHESYELAAYFYAKHVELKNSILPFFFLTGDEGFWEEISSVTIKNVIGSDVYQDFSGKEMWAQLMKKFNLFFIKKPYGPDSLKQWTEAIGVERILQIETPKACIDVILGAISITSGVRTLETYIKDMKDRQQSKERIEEVTNALKPYNDRFVLGTLNIVKGSGNINISNNEGKNIINDSVDNNSIKEIKEITDKLILNENLSDDKIKFFKVLRELKAKFPENVPDELLCPITREIFFEPSMTCDGQTFEKKAIEYWLTKNETSPLTMLKLNSKNIFPNIVMKKLVDDYFQANRNLI